LTKTSNQLSRDRAVFRDEFELAMQTQQHEEQVRSQSEALSRLLVQQGLDAVGRQDAELRSADALSEQEDKLAELRRDREKLVLRAPRAGTLLHGASKDFRPGRSPARWERGSQLAFRTELFMVVDPAPSAVALDLNDTDLAKLADGADVRIEVLGPAKASATGTARIERLPRSSNATEAVYEATVVLNKSLDGAIYGSRVKVVGDAGGTAQP
jgi:multidrug resistance efflux pump